MSSSQWVLRWRKTGSGEWLEQQDDRAVAKAFRLRLRGFEAEAVRRHA